MGIKLAIEAKTRLSDDDRDIVAGISAMNLAIANRQNLVAQTHMQEEDDLYGMERLYCGSIAPNAAGSGGGAEEAIRRVAPREATDAHR